MGQLRRATSCLELAPHLNPPDPQYEVGDTLRLKIYPTPLYSSAPHFVNAKVLKCFRPFTMSQVMVVHMNDPLLGPEGLESIFVLKLFGRRFMSNQRRRMKQPEWSPRLERMYRKHILRRPLHCEDYDTSDDSDSESEPESSPSSSPGSSPEPSPTESEIIKLLKEARNEAGIQEQCDEMFYTESEVYERLEDLQGKDIPRLIAHVELPMCYPSRFPWRTKYPDDNFAAEPGLLLQYIPNAFSLDDICKKKFRSPAPRKTWQYIIDDAVRIVRDIFSRDIVNLDVQLRNTLVRWDATTNKYKVFLIDLAQCQLRDKDNSDYEWRKFQSMWDNEGAIGVLMEGWLQKHRGGGYKFTRSEHWRKLREEFKHLI